jgi:nicotinate-nucleotide adenylyltransferase
MVKIAIQHNKFFEISDIEYKRGGKSYTYLTILELIKLYDIEDKINFIIGTDAFEKIESWYEADKLKKLIKFIVFIREENFDISKYNYLKARGYDFEFQPLTFENISSTQLREFIKNNKSISPYVPKQVEEYIKENELYKN